MRRATGKGKDLGRGQAGDQVSRLLRRQGHAQDFAEIKKGHVIAQKPKPGTRLGHGARIDLIVSKGK